MKNLIIISPDPEARTVLSLRFELNGFQSATAVDLEDATVQTKSSIFSHVIFDMMEDSPALWREVRKFLSGKISEKTLVILPRGVRDADKKFTGRQPSLIIHKPYEFEALVKEVDALSKVDPRSKPLRG